MNEELHPTADHLTLEEFTDALISGTQASWLEARADALLAAVDALVREQQPMTAERFRARAESPHALHRTLERIVRCMRVQIDPFSGVLEAPRSVARLYRDHRDAVKAAESARAHGLEPLLRDAAEAWFSCLAGPLQWYDLIARGVPREAPSEPPSDDGFL